eukprot:7411134-Ditylum_brightwellii.AAC.1
MERVEESYHALGYHHTSFSSSSEEFDIKQCDKKKKTFQDLNEASSSSSSSSSDDDGNDPILA